MISAVGNDMPEHFLARHLTGRPVCKGELNRFGELRLAQTCNVPDIPLIGFSDCFEEIFRFWYSVSACCCIGMPHTLKIGDENSIDNVSVIEDVNCRVVLRVG